MNYESISQQYAALVSALKKDSDNTEITWTVEESANQEDCEDANK